MQMVVVWDFTSFWQFNIIFCSMLDNHTSIKLKHTKMTSLTSFLRGCCLLSLLRPMLPSVRGFAISSDGYFYIENGMLCVLIRIALMKQF